MHRASRDAIMTGLFTVLPAWEPAASICDSLQVLPPSVLRFISTSIGAQSPAFLRASV